MLVVGTLFTLACLAHWAACYIPALPTNDSNAVATSLNESDTSSLSLQWYPNGAYAETVSYQLAGAESTGINQGALVLFSEDNDTTIASTTPWIALVSCDGNTTNASTENDIFTLAARGGAVAALLYSQWSAACIINTEFANPASFNGIMDIFSTKSLLNAQNVLAEFDIVNSTFWSFNATLLDQNSLIINESIADGSVPAPGYLFATLLASNSSQATGGSSSNNSSASSVPSESSSSSGGNSNTDLAMIVLYVITGAVSALFCIVILSGAIRAIRHPERYGPRARDPNIDGPGGLGQSRARGLTRAILDTFPVIKFSRPDPDGVDDAPPKPLDEESFGSRDHAMEMTVRSTVRDETARPLETPGEVEPGSTTAERIEEDSVEERVDEPVAVLRPRINTAARPSTVVTNPDSPALRDVVPESIGRETCPICIVDFEEGDDLRVLPCEGHHAFHQQCVDPWLLELSSSCPICRQDFAALESILSGEAPEEQHADSAHPHRELSAHPPRFSRYLRFARGRRVRSHRPWGNRDSLAEDPTNPPLPMATSTTLE